MNSEMAFKGNTTFWWQQTVNRLIPAPMSTYNL